MPSLKDAFRLISGKAEEDAQKPRPQPSPSPYQKAGEAVQKAADPDKLAAFMKNNPFKK